MNNITIVLNSSNYDTATKSFRYRLKNAQQFQHKKVGLAYCSIYKQFNNISAESGNNQFTITWINGEVYTHTIPDGNYTIEQIDLIFKNVFEIKKWYCNDFNNSRNKIGFLDLYINPTAYGSQLVFYPVPTSSEASNLGYTIPSGANWTFPITSTNLKISFGAKFGSLFGFSAGIYGQGSSPITLNSDITPQIALVNTLIIRSNLVNDSIAEPFDVLNALDASGEFGSLLKFQSNQILYNNIASNTFSEIVVYFSDQNLNHLNIRDPEVCIILSLIDV